MAPRFEKFTTPHQQNQVLAPTKPNLLFKLGLTLIIHWQGGDHTRLTVKKNRPGQTRWTTDVDVVDLVRALARQMPDETIASVLNRSGKLTGYGNSWTRGRICSLRRQYHIPIYREGERVERGEVTLNEVLSRMWLEIG